MTNTLINGILPLIDLMIPMKRLILTHSLVLGLSGPAGLALAQGTAPVLTSAEPTVFREVTAKLDAGGSLYAYLSTDQFLRNFSGKLGGLQEFVLSLPDLGPGEREGLEQTFTLIRNVVQRSGVEGIAGVGVSGIALEKGFYRTRFVAQRAPDADGYVWQWFGSKPHPLTALDWLPEDTVYAVFGDLDLAAIWSALLKNAADAGLSEAVKGLRELSARVRQATGRSLEDHLGSLGGEAGVALILDGRRRVQFEAGGVSLKDLPEPALLLAFKVNDETVYEWLDALLRDNPQSVSGQSDTARWRSLHVPAPVPFVLRPTVARLGDYLLVTSSDQLVEKVDLVRGGKAPGLKASPEWQRLARGLPTEGNSFSFVSRLMGETLAQIQQAFLAQTATQNGDNLVHFRWLEQIIGASAPAASYAVGWTDATGSQFVSQGTQEPAVTLVNSALVAPAAVMAGMLLPEQTCIIVDAAGRNAIARHEQGQGPGSGNHLPQPSETDRGRLDPVCQRS